MEQLGQSQLRENQPITIEHCAIKRDLAQIHVGLIYNIILVGN